MNTQIKDIITDDARLVNGYLSGLYTEGDVTDACLDSAVRYSLLGGGKRIRAALTLEFYKCLSGKEPSRAAVSFAAAVEMVHAFSLIHDDLPCMDDDDMRRGKPTNHKVYGEAVALLAGDGLALDAFSVVANAPDITPELALTAVGVLADCAGTGGMVRGQIVDMYGETHVLTREQITRLDALKTGKLIEAACRLGVLSAGFGMDSPQMDASVRYARGIGEAFQITDDILDVTSDAKTMGKAVGKDAAHHKNTTLSYVSLEQAAQLAERLTRDAIDAVSPYDVNGTLTALAEFLSHRKN